MATARASRNLEDALVEQLQRELRLSQERERSALLREQSANQKLALQKLQQFMEKHSRAEVATRELVHDHARVFEGFPEVVAGTAEAVWRAVEPLQTEFDALPKAAPEDNRHNDDPPSVHFVADKLLSAVDAALSVPMRRWYERPYAARPPDDRRGNGQSDYTYTHRREGAVHAGTMLTTVEVKTRSRGSTGEGTLKSEGLAQALQRAALRAYTTHRLAESERASTVRAWGLGVVMMPHELAVVRAEISIEPGKENTSFFCTPWLPLWPAVAAPAPAVSPSRPARGGSSDRGSGGGDASTPGRRPGDSGGRGSGGPLTRSQSRPGVVTTPASSRRSGSSSGLAPRSSPSAPPSTTAGIPSGLAALARVLMATPAQLCGINEAVRLTRIPPQVFVQHRRRLECAAGDAVIPFVECGDRLGSGGFCDVYASTLNDENVAVKIARLPESWDTLSVECACLRYLAKAASPHIPRVLASELCDDSDGGGSVVGSGSETIVSLVLAPQGTSLIQEHAAVRSNPTAVAELAKLVLHGVLRALRAAHGRGWLHCDVRPSNIVMYAGGAVLIDWGLAERSTPVRKRKGVFGVEAFLHDDILDACGRQPLQEYKPLAVHDLASAVYVHAAILHGADGCEPPWTTGGTAAHQILAARNEWVDTLEKGSTTDGLLMSIAVNDLESIYAQSDTDT